jgi:PAS domain S-box-containing protein
MTAVDDTAARLSLLRRVAEIANAADTVAAAAVPCIDLVCRHTGWPVGHLFELDTAAGVLRSSGLWRAEDPGHFRPLEQASEGLAILPGEALPGLVMERGGPVVFDRLADGPPVRRADIAERCGVRAAFAFPVWVRDEVLAVLEFFATEEGSPDEPTLELLDQIGRQLGRVVERQQHASALSASEEHFRRVIDAAGDAFVAIDSDNGITEWNAAAEVMLGWSRDEILGRRLVETILPGRYRAAHLAGVERFLETGEGPLLGHRLEVAACHRDGRELPMELGIWAVQDHDGRWSFNAFLHDITERRAAQRELQSAYERERDMVAQLTQLDRNKADFMSMVSHELRTPLTSILGYVDLLRGGHGGPLEPSQDQMLEVVDRNAHRLLDLIDDIVTLDRLESGRIPLEPSDVEVAHLVEQVVAAVSPLASTRGQHLVTDVRPGTGVLVGDASQLERVLLNLTSNAVKFTPRDGSIRVVADGDAEHVRLTVIDTGMGIPADEQPRIFTRFFRSSLARAGAVPGTGLGLVIARSIVEAHRGTIELVSAEGEGTVVTVTLPRVLPDS